MDLRYFPRDLHSVCYMNKFDYILYVYVHLFICIPTFDIVRRCAGRNYAQSFKYAKKCKSKYNEITEFTNITNDNLYIYSKFRLILKGFVT